MKDERKSPDKKNNKVAIAFSLGGRIFSKIELSSLEFNEIRSLCLEDAIQKLIKEDPNLRIDRRLAAQIVRHIENGKYLIKEYKKPK